MTLKFWNIFVSTISELTDILPLIVLILIHKSKYRILQLYFLLSFVIKLLTIALVFGFNSPNTHPFYHLLAILEFTCLFIYYNNEIGGKKSTMIFVLILVGMINIANTIFFQPLNQFNSHAWSINTLILLAMSVAYLYVLYLKAENISIEMHSGFIINAGFLIYFAGSLFIYLFGFSILSEEKRNDFFANSWIITSIANLCKNGIVTYGIIRNNGNK